MTHMIFLAACVLGAVVICVPLFVLLGASRRGAGINYDDNYQPRVTIITPMYNEGASIRRTIASLLLQDYPIHLREIIIVDDCSSDDSYDHAVAALHADALHTHGIALAIYPALIRNSVGFAMREALHCLKVDGATTAMRARMISGAEYNAYLGLAEVEGWEARFPF